MDENLQNFYFGSSWEWIYQQKMDKKLKSILKSQIETYLQKKPHASDGKIMKSLYIGAVPGPDTVNAIKKESLRSFVVYQKKKFAMHGFCADHLKGKTTLCSRKKDCPGEETDEQLGTQEHPVCF